MATIETEDREFEAKWRVRYEAVGGRGLSDAEKISYPPPIFNRRDRFLRHVIGDLAVHVKSLSAPGARCLDIGCNAGLYTNVIHEHGMDVSGVDYSASLVAEARATFPGLKFSQASAYSLPFADHSFDVATCFGVIQCLEDWRSALSEMLRILKPGGVGVVETNRSYSTAENMLRCGSYVIRRKLSPGDAWIYYRRHRASGRRHPDDCDGRCYPVSMIANYLTTRGAGSMILHDPQRCILYHRVESWAVTFTAPAAGQAPDVSNTRHVCRKCRRW